MVKMSITDTDPAKNSKRFNNYTLAIFATFAIGIGIVLPLLIAHCLAVGTIPDWLIDIIYVLFGITSVSQFVSGNGYVQQFTDAVFKDKTLFHPLLSLISNKFSPQKDQPGLDNHSADKKLVTQETEVPKNQEEKKAENPINAKFFGLTLGLIVAIGLTIFELIQHVPMPYVSDIGRLLAGAIFFIANVSTFAGLTNRIGATLDYFISHKKKDKASEEKPKELLRRKSVNYSLAIIVGVIVGLAISILVLTTVGVTSAMTFGGAIPFWLGAGLFVLATTSTIASASGYGGRVADYLLGERSIADAIIDFISPNKETKKPEETKNNTQNNKQCNENKNSTFRSRSADPQNIGTAIGVIIGILLAIILLAAGVTTLPFFGAGIPLFFSSLVLIAFCISGCGGLGNRLGFAIGKIMGVDADLQKANEDTKLNTVKAVPTASSDDTYDGHPDNNNNKPSNGPSDPPVPPSAPPKPVYAHILAKLLSFIPKPSSSSNDGTKKTNQSYNPNPKLVDVVNTSPKFFKDYQRESFFIVEDQTVPSERNSGILEELPTQRPIACAA